MTDWTCKKVILDLLVEYEDGAMDAADRTDFERHIDPTYLDALSKAYSDTPTIDGKRFGCNIGAGLICADLTELAGHAKLVEEQHA